MQAHLIPDTAPPTYFLPVRPATVQERNRLTEARRVGPFVAWRDGSRELQVHRARAGQARHDRALAGNTISLAHLLVSRDHAEVLLRSAASRLTLGVPARLAVQARHRAASAEDGERAPRRRRGHSGPPRASPADCHCDCTPGDHDVQLAGEVWIRIGGVPVDQGATGDRDYDLPEPTKRERDVLVELCRPPVRRRREPCRDAEQRADRRARQAAIGAERVSDLLSQMYAKYELAGTKEQNRFELVELAMQHRLVRPEDYI